MTIQVLRRPSVPIISRDHRFLTDSERTLSTTQKDTQHPSKVATASGVDTFSLIHSLFEEQAERNPNSIAIEFEAQQLWTYQSLNFTANAVARQLGSVQGSIIPISIPRSANLIIALLAVLKAGAAYVLLSTDSPPDRNRFIVEDTKAPVVIVDEGSQGIFTPHPELSIETLIANAKRMPKKYQQDLNIYQDSSTSAYLIYTSGTTGRPKGCILSHLSAYSGIIAMPDVGEPWLFKQLLCHSPNFSAAQRTILGTLCRGGSLCVASKDNITLHLSETITSMGISTLEITPSMLKLIDTLPPTLKKITLGGEVVSPALVAAWAEKVELWSAYGLSECTQLNMRHKLRVNLSSRTIGRPTDGTQFYVLALDTLEQVQLGTSGELCLGGNQLAQGYLNLPEKTQEAFIPNPFGSGRLYRTGDMVIANEDGTVDLIGRIDQQTKIEGQRVEPNESNSLIQVQQGVVHSSVVSASINDRRALVAIIVAEKGSIWVDLVKEIRSTLRNILPSYAIPRYWLQQEILPLNVSGKVDISSLVRTVEGMEIDRLMLPSSTTLSTPFSAGDYFESRIAGIIASTLSISLDTISLESSFQELGGSSLDAIVIASGLRKINIHVAVSDILQSTSIRDIAASRIEVAADVPKPIAPFSLLPEGFKMDLSTLEDAYPVTPLQESILADSIMGNANYVYRRVYRLQNASSTLLRSAMETVIARSSILRTTFFPCKKSFVQVVHAAADLPWSNIEDKTLQEYFQDPSVEEMPIHGPLLRVTIVEKDWLILEMHHALFDFWSNQFIMDDTIAVMQNKVPTPRLPFSSYVAWQQRKHDEQARSFWKSYLQNRSECLLDLQKSVQSTSRSSIVLTQNIGSSLIDFSQAHGVTIGTSLHAAWALTLASVLKSTDVTFVTAFSGRDADLDGILTLDGPTLCTVPFRVNLEDSSSNIAEFTKKLQSNLWNLSKFAHSGMRNALAAASALPNSFNTMVNMLVKLPGVTDDSPLLPSDIHGDNYTQYITMEVSETNPTVVKLLVPSSGDQSAAQKLLDVFASIIKTSATNSKFSVSQVLTSHLAPRVDAEVYSPSTETSPAPPTFGLAHSSFEAFSASNPTKTAIHTASGRSLSYGELNARANSFASWLIKRGVQHGEMIPLYMEKSPETIIAIFGIMKAGASFTPLDPLNPHDRNAFIIKDVGALRIVSDRRCQEACKSFGPELIILEDMNLSAESDETPAVVDLDPSSNIYAIYTSGSTGLPKGVLVTHSAVTAATEGMIEATGVTSEWNALWVLNYVFDASYYDVFTLFSAGATLCLAPQEELLSNLAGYINDLEIEQVMLTPTITKLISGGPSQVPRLKVLNVCGERIDTNILKWSESVDVFNGYGPTECTILMTESHVKPGSSLKSIGYPLKHVSAFIVDPEGTSLQRLPHGATGELCVRGAHLAKGYLNRPEQTNKSFVRDVDGELLYRTGDLARWTDQGTLECLGRKDYQIKLNGFRIELGEIENAILQVDTGEVEAVIVSVAEINGKKQLVAFIIFTGDYAPGNTAPLPPTDRLDRIGALIPRLTTVAHYMLPALWLPFNSLPTLPSGKANRKALVAQAEAMSKHEIAEYIPHDKSLSIKVVSTEEERVMQHAWASVLDEPEEKIGANSVFLSLGGDSISAINVVAALRQLNYNISVSYILSNPTLAEQAKHLKRMEGKKTTVAVKYEVPSTILTALERASLVLDRDIEVVYPAGAGQTEFLIQGHKKEQFWNLTACRELPQEFDLEHWKHTTTSLTARNQILRTMYSKADQADESSWYQIVFKHPILNYEYIFYQNEMEKIRYMEELRDSTFDFGKPNIKYRILHSLETGNRTLCIKVDHGSYDGTLLRIFDDQFKPMARGEAGLPPVHSFKTFIDWAYSSDRSSALKYWKNALQGLTPAHNLPLQPSANKLKFATVSADVESIAALYSVTASTVFQAAYALAAGRLVGTKDVLVDNLLTGRNADVENPQLLNGTCANFLPFRSQLSENMTTAKFLKDTQAQFWDTTEHGVVGLHDIYKALGQNRQVHSAKLLYCFQPFEPVAKTSQVDHMRWIVMAQSKVFMSINYALMLEVQKTMAGHRLKLQWDGRVMGDLEVDGFVQLMELVMGEMAGNSGGHLESLMGIETGLESVWKA